jgi:hypothetical protein
MHKRKKTFWKVFINPLLFGTYPLISLTAKNSIEIHISDGYRALAYCLLGIVSLTLLLLWLYRDEQKASLVSTTILFFFFSYGYILFALQQINSKLGNHFFGLGITLVFLSLIILAVKVLKRNWEPITNTLTVVGLVALMLPAYKIISIEINAARFRKDYVPLEMSAPSLTASESQKYPDIYYIILDAYGRDDTLRSLFGLDNSEFIDSISDMGFFVGRCSRSNYSMTRLSLSSSLNMNYLDDLIDLSTSDNGNAIALGHIIKHSLTREFLEEIGYQTYAFETGYVWTQIEDADFYLSITNTHDEITPLNQTRNTFEDLLLQTSILSSMYSFQNFLPAYLIPNLNQHEILHRNQVLFDFDQLEKIPTMPGNKFVFAHIVSPHYPFVFTKDGSFPDDTSNEAKAYTDQLLYINTRVIQVIHKIIDVSDEPPIIILQGDHGPQIENSLEEMKILNAYFLPDVDIEDIPTSISPVNTFRIVFNNYFGMDYPLLENLSYASSTHTPYDFTIVFDDRPDCPVYSNPE